MSTCSECSGTDGGARDQLVAVALDVARARTMLSPAAEGLPPVLQGDVDDAFALLDAAVVSLRTVAVGLGVGAVEA